jgi:hypothetical protein
MHYNANVVAAKSGWSFKMKCKMCEMTPFYFVAMFGLLQ